ncbi:MAG: hypothetical protein ACK5Q5_23430 [Planctomycetaceae bacterium]
MGVLETRGNGLFTTRWYVAGRNLQASINSTAVGNYSYTWDVNGTVAAVQEMPSAQSIRPGCDCRLLCVGRCFSASCPSMGS